MTYNELENILYTNVKTYLGTNIGGSTYKRGLRPFIDRPTSANEDAVVGVVTGQGSDIMNGTCVVNVYVPDVQVASGSFYENKARCLAVEQLLTPLPKYLFDNTDIFFKRVEMIMTIAEENTKEHFVSLKMDFKVLVEN